MNVFIHIYTTQILVRMGKTLQDTARHCKTLQDTVRHCTTLQDTARHCKTLQHTARYCNTLHILSCKTPVTQTQQPAHVYVSHVHLRILIRMGKTLHDTARRCKTLQDTARHCTTLHDTARHCTTLHDTATHDTTTSYDPATYLYTQHCSTLQHMIGAHLRALE